VPPVFSLLLSVRARRFRRFRRAFRRIQQTKASGVMGRLRRSRRDDGAGGRHGSGLERDPGSSTGSRISIFVTAPVWETTLYFARKAPCDRRSRAVLLFRHRQFPAFFCASFLFYLMCARLFKDWKFGLLGWLMLVLAAAHLRGFFLQHVRSGFSVFFIAGGFTLFSSSRENGCSKRSVARAGTAHG